MQKTFHLLLSHQQFRETISTFAVPQSSRRSIHVVLAYEGSDDRSCKDFIISARFIQLLSNLFWRVLHLALPACRLNLRTLGCVQSSTQSSPRFLPQQISSKELNPPSSLFLVGWVNRSEQHKVSSSRNKKSPTPTCYFCKGKFGAERKFLFLRFL